MAVKRMRKLALLAKIETTYDTDPVPTGAANAMMVTDVEITPLDGDVVERDFVRGYFGNSGAIQTTFFGRMKFKTELAASGTAGTAPKWDPLMRACSMSVTTSAGVSVTYAPITDNPESVTLYANIDGINHSVNGARGTCKLVLDAKGRPMMEWDIMGTFNPLTDTALPLPVYTGWTKPVGVNKINTTCTLHGTVVSMQHFDLDIGTQVVKRDLTNTDDIEIVDRKTAGSISFEQTPVATKDWVTLAKNTTLGNLSLVHGITAGNIVTINATGTCELSKPSFSNQDGIQLMNLQNRYVPSSNGNDEFNIVLT